MTTLKYRTPCGDTFYHDGPIKLAAYRSLDALKAGTMVSRRTWFEKDTLAFFGVRDQSLVKASHGCAIVERHDNAPCDEMRYRVSIFHMTGEHECAPFAGCFHPNKVSAMDCAHQWWRSFGPDANPALMRIES